MRWAFTRFYREFAWTYDTVASGVSGGQWPMWSLAALSFLRGRVLELGCGTGNLQRALAGQPGVAGIDISRQMLAITARKQRQVGQQPRLARADAGHLPFAAASFDTLVATFPSEYIIAPATVAEITRLLRPGGQLVVILAAQFHGPTLSRRMIDTLYRLTLQRPVLAPAKPAPPTSLVGARFHEAGFHTREFWHPSGSRDVALHVIIAEQPANRTVRA